MLARQIFSQGEEAVIFALLALAKQLADQKSASAAVSHQTPSTPSGMNPPYTKPPLQSLRPKVARRSPVEKTAIWALAARLRTTLIGRWTTKRVVVPIA